MISCTHILSGMGTKALHNTYVTYIKYFLHPCMYVRVCSNWWWCIL